jgi:L-arabinose isomerase
VQPLSIGGKENPARLIFTAPAGPAICASLIDLGNRFRMVVNEVEVVVPPADLPKLPVARVLWDPKPNLKVAAEAWILAGGAHHSVFTQALTSKYVEDYCEIAGIEYVLINEETEIRKFKQDLRLGEIYYHLARGI